MIKSITQFFENYIKPPADSSDEISEHALQLATAALMIEMMRADSEISEQEEKAVFHTIKCRFELTEEETKTLIVLAEEEIWKSTGYFEFTSLINNGFSYQQKIKIVEHLWQVAFADAELDRHEEYMVRKIADLLYVTHKDFIEAKLRMRDR